MLNVDESWLSSTAFKRYSWAKAGRGNVRPQKELKPRASFLAAIDNRGAAYISLGTSITDSGVMIAFLSELCKL